MPQTAISQDYVAHLRGALDELHKFQTRPTHYDFDPLDKAKRIFEAIPSALRESVLKKAMGSGIRLFRAAASMIAACESSDFVDEWITVNLTHHDKERRDWMIQTVGDSKLFRFADSIAEIIENDPECRWFAVLAAEQLRAEECLDSLIALADSFEKGAIPFGLIQALSRYDSPRVLPYLQRVFRSHSAERERGCAAWGLARQNDQEAINYLVVKLDDLDEDDTPSLESRRAAQALSDIYGWELEWTPQAPNQAKQLWQRKTNPPKT